MSALPQLMDDNYRRRRAELKCMQLILPFLHHHNTTTRKKQERRCCPGPGSNRVQTIFDKPLVMRTLMRLLPTWEVLKFRRLSRVANEEACSLLNQRPAGNRCQWIVSSWSMIRFTSVAQCRKPGFPSLQFNSFTIAPGIIPVKVVMTFARTMGPEIRELEILCYGPECTQRASILYKAAVNLENMDIYEGIMLDKNTLPESLPNLRELRIVPSYDPLTLNLCKQVLRRTPALKHIWISSCSELCFKSLPSLLYNSCIVSPPPEISISAIVINPNVISTCLDKLRSKGYHGLRELKLYQDFYYSGPISSALILSVMNLLQLNQESMRILMLRFGRRGAPQPVPEDIPIFSLPKMTKLTELGLTLCCGPTACPLTQFLPGQFPALRDLSIGFYRTKPAFRSDWHLFPALLVIPTLMALSLNDYIGNADSETWHISFPNLKYLCIQNFPSISFMKYLLTRLTFLENIRIGWGRYNWEDDGKEETMWDVYTGGAKRVAISEILKKIQRKDEEINKNGVVPSFGNMQRLERLELFIGSRVEYEAMAYICSRSLLPNLKYLRMNVYDHHGEDIIDKDLTSVFQIRPNIGYLYYFELPDDV